MQKVLLTLSIAISLPLTFLATANAEASNFLEFGDRNFETKKSTWVFNLGFDYMKYPTVLPSFTGTHHKVKDETEVETGGAFLGLGGDLYLGAGISTTLKLGAFYHNNFNKEVGTASKEVDIDLANTQQNYLIQGGEASLSLNYLIETDFVDMQPFVEAAFGSGNSRIKEEYNFDGLTAATTDDEFYKMESKDIFAYNKLSLGINFISSYGIISYFKVTDLMLNVSEREVKGSFKKTADLTSTSIDSKTENLKEDFHVLSASIGAGCLF